MMDMKEQIDKNIRDLATGLKTYFDQNFPGIPYPVIAGGSIRDQRFGVVPKDYDIFFDIGVFPPEERDDVFTIIKHELMKVFPNTADFAEPMIGLDPMTGLYGLTDKNVFSVESWRCVGTMVQLIVKTPENSTYDNLINGFDYDLVRCYFDLNTMTYVFTEAFLASEAKKEIVVNSKTTAYRVNNWISRGRNCQTLPTFRIIWNYPEKEITTNPCAEILLDTMEFVPKEEEFPF